MTEDILAVEYPYAHLSLRVKQAPTSLEVITEKNPLELAELFGNVGGFWGESSPVRTYQPSDVDRKVVRLSSAGT